MVYKEETMEKTMGEGVSRRNFLKGAGLAGAAALAAGVASGCSPQGNGEKSLGATGDAGAAASTGAATPGYATTEDWLTRSSRSSSATSWCAVVVTRVSRRL